MIQDIAPHTFFNQYSLRKPPVPEDIVLAFDGSKLLVDNSSSLPTVKDFGTEQAYTYLFSLDNVHFFLLLKPETYPEALHYVEWNQLRRDGCMEQHFIFAAVTGKHLADWYRDTQFCGRCGGKMQHSDNERAMVCTCCKYTVYPRIMPAVIVGVTNGSKLLLTKYRVGYGHNALIAGFTEIGETLEETVSREVMEEAGIHVKNIRYYKSQPWGIANDILVGYFCDVDGDPQIHMDSQELKYAEWVEREEIVLQPDNFSLTNEMMTIFKEGKII